MTCKTVDAPYDVDRVTRSNGFDVVKEAIKLWNPRVLLSPSQSCSTQASSGELTSGGVGTGGVASEAMTSMVTSSDVLLSETLPSLSVGVLVSATAGESIRALVTAPGSRLAVKAAFNRFSASSAACFSFSCRDNAAAYASIMRVCFDREQATYE